MRYPVKPVTLPSDLRGSSNGKLAPNLLVRLSTGGHLHHRAATAWEAMRAHAARDGITLGHVGAYRSYDQQKALFEARYSTSPTGRVPQVTRTWNGKTYYLKPGNSPSATPSTSNHGWGLAIDVASIGSGGRLPWLLTHAGNYGFTWEVEDPKNPNFEAWHIRFVLGDATPPALNGTTPTTPTPIRDLRRGDTGEDVKKLQWALTDAGYLCKADGQFGPITERIVKDFQRHHGLKVDGIVGPKTRAALGL
jgi:hypothetical protein